MKVLLVDDEPFILQGLSVLIDWAAEGCEIVKMASNGKEALLYLELVVNLRRVILKAGVRSPDLFGHDKGAAPFKRVVNFVDHILPHPRADELHRVA